MHNKKIELVVLDVDGTLTDGSVYYGTGNVEIKKFNVKDAAGILSIQAVGIPCMILTGRESEAVKRRGQDLHIKYVEQGVSDKEKYLRNFLSKNDITVDSVIYIGDDLNDLSCMKMVGHAACPFDAAEEVRNLCEYISEQKGGAGAVRDIIFHYLKEMDLYSEAIGKAYSGI